MKSTEYLGGGMNENLYECRHASKDSCMFPVRCHLGELFFLVLLRGYPTTMSLNVSCQALMKSQLENHAACL